MNRLLVLIASAAALLAADLAIAQGVPGDRVEDIKIGPFIAGQRLRASDVVQYPLGVQHYQPDPTLPPHWPGAGWAGYKFTVHVLDNTEVDVDAVGPYPYDPTTGEQPPQHGELPQTDPFGPRSQNQVSHPIEWMRLHPLHYLSGLPGPPTSHQYRVADLKLHIKGTNNPAGNSDTDVQVKLWNVWHVRQDSHIAYLKESDRIWLPTMFPPANDPPYPSGNDPRWLHIEQPQPFPFHFLASQYYATLAKTFNIGIDHIPEPLSGVLLGLGVLCAVMGARSRWRCRR
jgi:hypothetical protein